MDTLRQARWQRLRALMMTSPWLLSLLLAGCAVHSIERFSAGDTETERQARVVAAVRELGRDGDWLVIRGYHASDNLVSSLTNMPFSHVAVLDADRDEVIEAESPRVHTESLQAFVVKSQRLMLVRPVWSAADAGTIALAKARTLVNRPYDFLGVVGLDIPDQYYCSELAIEIYRPFVRREDIVPRPVAPGQLHYWGRVLFDSGAR
jgi:hypothetical protein